MRLRYVVAAEFDLNAGSTVKMHHPKVADPIFFRNFADLLIPDGVHSRSNDWTMVPVWETPDGKLDYIPRGPGYRQLYVCNRIRSDFGERHKRGARIQALAVITPEPAYAALMPLVEKASEKLDDDSSVVRELYMAVMRIDTSYLVPAYDWYEKRLLDTNGDPQVLNNFEAEDCHYVPLNATLDDTSVHLKYPTFADGFNAGSFSISKLIKMCAASQCRGYDPVTLPLGSSMPTLIALFLAMLCGKRILVYGDQNMTCQELCEYVQAIGYVGSVGGLLDTNSKVYSYIELSRVEDLLMLTEGFVAGTTNAAFLLHPEWFDFVFDLEKKKFIFSTKEYMVPDMKPTLPPEDLKFFDNLKQAEKTNSEYNVRSVVSDFFAQFLRRARYRRKELAGCNGSEDNDAFLLCYGFAANAWSSLSSQIYYDKAAAHEAPICDAMQRLVSGRADAPEVFMKLSEEIKSPDDVGRLLLIPHAVYFISLGLFHRSAVARELAAGLMHYIGHHPSGAHFLRTLPPAHSIGLRLADKMRNSDPNA